MYVQNNKCFIFPLEIENQKSKHLHVAAAKNYIFSIKMFFYTNKFFLDLPWKQSLLTDHLSIKFFPQIYISQFETSVVMDKWVQREQEGESPAMRSTSVSSHVIPNIYLPTRGLTTTHNLTSDEVPQGPKIQAKVGLVLQEKSQNFPNIFNAQVSGGDTNTYRLH